MVPFRSHLPVCACVHNSSLRQKLLSYEMEAHFVHHVKCFACTFFVQITPQHISDVAVHNLLSAGVMGYLHKVINLSGAE